MIDESAKDSGRKWDNICEEMRNFSGEMLKPCRRTIEKIETKNITRNEEFTASQWAQRKRLAHWKSGQ